MKIAVIGAGVSGLPAIKSCVEAGLEVVCYEKTTDIGGLWNYRPDQGDVGGTVMKSTVVNTSKEMMAYSDFPPPENWSNFMHHSYVKKYLDLYAERFDLRKHIRLNSEVKSVKKDVETSKWRVELKNGSSEIFDKIMLCTGHHSIPRYPQLRGVEKFKGKILHAKEYRDYHGFEEKNVFLLGIGNSALDIAVELSKISKSVTISTRRGTWVFNRAAQAGMPYDIIFQTRIYYWLMKILPWTITNDFMEHRLQQRLDHDLYGLRPNHRFFQQHPAVNDNLANLLSSGLITITEDVETFDESGIIVKGGRRFEADILILCTGYTFSFPYLDPATLIPIIGHEVDLYKFVFPPKNPDLAVIGLIQPIGSVSPISEMQSRWAVEIFSGRRTLPPKQEMYNDIEEKRRLQKILELGKKNYAKFRLSLHHPVMKRRYFQSSKHTVQVDFVPYMDELAEIIGCKPPLQKLFFENPRFFLRLFVGANVPYVYRLIGPNQWSGAKNAIMAVPERVKFPMKNRQCRTRRHKKRGTLDEYFRYSSMKWLAGWTTIILVAGLWIFCSGPQGMSAISYFSYVTVFLALFSFMLLWFDWQYDMSTIF